MTSLQLGLAPTTSHMANIWLSKRGDFQTDMAEVNADAMIVPSLFSLPMCSEASEAHAQGMDS